MKPDLINTLERASEFDALAKLRPGEPYFVLIGRDTLAPARVQEWAKANRQRAFDDWDAGKISEADRDYELAKSTQAEQIGWEMVAYKKGHRPVDPPKPDARPTYTGHELPEECAARDREHRLRSRAGSVIHNSIAELNNLAGELQGTDDDVAFQLYRLVERLRDEATAVAPRRPILEAAQ